MKHCPRIATGLLIVLLASGCSTTRNDAYDPANNETTRNILSASLYCSILQLHDFLPGVSADQGGKIEMLGSPELKEKADYPWEINLRLSIESEPSVGYWYTVRRASPKALWYLAKAWKGDSTGKIAINSLPLPTDEQQLIANDKLKSIMQ